MKELFASPRKINFPNVLLFLIFITSSVCFAQTSKLDTSQLEKRMRNPMVYDRGQYPQQWLILGNIPAKWNEGIDKDFLSNAGGEANINPQEGQYIKLANGTELVWKKLQNSDKILDFTEIFKDSPAKKPIENIVRYAYTYINRINAGKAILAIGSDDAVKVWLNGKLVHRNMVYRRAAADQDLIDVELNKGDNYFLFKSVQTEWGKSFTARIIEDINVRENTVQKVQMNLNDNPTNTTITISSAPLFKTITKQQPVQISIYSIGGKTVYDQTIMRGDTISLNYSSWNNGPYEIKYVYTNLNGLSCTDYINWFKGDILKMAQEVVNSAPENKITTTEALTHRMIADFLKDRVGSDFNTTDSYKKSLLQPMLMEFNEMKAGKQIRPGGFIRLAYIDEVDGTPQFCRCYLPPDYNPSKKTSLVVFLHGYNPDNPDYIHWWSVDKRHDANVDRYNFILIEPHGRGNTQYFGIGDRDVMRCIQMAKEKFNVDEDKVYLTGASMGGGGTWRIGSVHPEKFAAIVPIFGGWDYRINNQIDLSSIEEFVSDKGSSTCQFESLVNMPILALHGDNDKLVNVENTRYLIRMLQRWGYNIRYIEVPEKGHEDLGFDDVIYPWLFQHTRNTNPKQVRIRAAELGTASAYWVKVMQSKQPWKMINVQADILINNIIRVNSDNVLELVLSLNENLVSYAQPVNVIWNGKPYLFNNLTDGKIILCDEEAIHQKIHKTPEAAGPIGDFLNTPFVLVIGTMSKDSVMQHIIKFKADGFVSFWKNYQRFSPRIFKDTEINDSILKNYSLYLLGGPKENKVAAQLDKLLPFHIKTQTITIFNEKFQAPDAVLEAIYPNPFNNKRYVRLVAPTSYEGMYFYEPNNNNLSNFDYTITNGSILNPALTNDKISGIATGVFDYSWNLDTSYLNKANPKVIEKSLKRKVTRDLKVEFVNSASPSYVALQNYSGSYEIEKQNFKLKVSIKDGKLVFTLPNGFEVGTTAISDTEFFVNAANIVISFQKEKNNDNFFMMVYQGSFQAKCKKIAP